MIKGNKKSSRFSSGASQYYENELKDYENDVHRMAFNTQNLQTQNSQGIVTVTVTITLH